MIPGMADEQYSETKRDEYQEGILDDSKQKKVGFFRSWLNIGRDSAMKGLDIGNNAVNQINQTIRSGMEAKYQAEIAKAEAEAKAKYGSSDSDEYKTEIENLRKQLEEQREKDIAEAEQKAADAAKKAKSAEEQLKAAEESAKQAADKAAEDAAKADAEKKQVQVDVQVNQPEGHTEEEWEWVTEKQDDGSFKGKWVLKSTK